MLRNREGDIEALRERCKAALRATDAERLARGQAERRVARLAHEAEALRALPALAGFGRAWKALFCAGSKSHQAARHVTA